MRQNFKQVFKLTIPVLGAYWFLGITYGLLASEMGYSIWAPVSMAIIVYSGSVEFIALTMLMGSFHPLASIAMALMVGARHLFYGISMLERYRGAGWRKPFLDIQNEILETLLSYEEIELYDQYLYPNAINGDSVKVYNERFRTKFPNSFLLFPENMKLFEYLIEK